MKKSELGRKECKKYGMGYYHLSAADGGCGYCTISGLNEMLNYGMITPKQYEFYVNKLGGK